MEMRLETKQDIEAIGEITKAAFKDMPYSDGAEVAIVNSLREQQVLTLSLVAVEEGHLVGHIAFSPVKINSEYIAWYGLGPVSVLPRYQRRGIGQALVNEGILRLKNLGAKGCVLVGNPTYYSRFGFECVAELTYSQAPAEYFQRLVFVPPPPKGEVRFHPAFEETR